MHAVFVDCTDELAAILGRLGLQVPAELQVNHGNPSRDQLMRLCSDAEVLLVEHTVIPPDAIRAARKLRAVIFLGTGASTYVPLEVCAELGIPVLTTPGYANRGRSSSRVTSRHFDHGNGSRAFTFKLFRSG
ncbi:MAG: hypothetical protein KAX55_02585 [Propionivibrio sp.]|nr:hypothetical protein [Propionivibrio sp.]